MSPGSRRAFTFLSKSQNGPNRERHHNIHVLYSSCIMRSHGTASVQYFGNCTAPPRAALFHFHTGRPLTSRAMRAILKDLLLRGGYDTSKYNTHSLRIGAATAAVPSTIHHPAAGKMEQHCLHHLHPASTDKSFRHSNSSISTMTQLRTHSHTSLGFTLLPGTKSIYLGV